MPISISNYKRISQEHGSTSKVDKTVHLSEAGDELLVHGGNFSGKITSWFRGFRSAQNTAVRKNFLEALTSQYGEDVVAHVTANGQLNYAASIKKPLTAREIFLAFEHADKYKAQIDTQNIELASQYGTDSASGYQLSPRPVDSKLEEVLSRTFKRNEDTKGIRESIDFAAVGKEIKEQAREYGGGKHVLDKVEVDAIAEQVLGKAVAEVHNKSMLNKYLAANGRSEAAGKGSRGYINRGIETAVSDAMYKTDTPAILTEDQVAEIAEHTIQKFTRAEQAVESLNISDNDLKEKVISFAVQSNLSPSQVKRAWETGMQMKPHLKVIAGADEASEKELKGAVNGYLDIISELSASDSDASLSFESEKNESILMMMAQGEDTAEKLHDRMTKPGAFNSYIRAMNHYRFSFPATEHYQEQKSLYRPGMQRAQRFSAWTESLGFALAEQLGKPGGEAEILAESKQIESFSDIDDQTLNLMRNTGMVMPAPDRINQEGGGTFCDEAMEQIGNEISTGKLGSVKDDICEQFRIDIGVRSTAYFEGEEVDKDAEKVEARLKEFCTNEEGVLDRNMLFAVSQIHQGTIAPLQAVFHQGGQMSPLPGIFVGGDASEYHYDKANDGSVLVKMISKKVRPQLFGSPERGHIELDSDKSSFEMAVELRLNPETFTAARDHYFPPELINATYQYKLYAQDE